MVMNRLALALKRPFIWLRRFRHRCGYGVHSPFAFELITQVIYQRTPYYKYTELAETEKKESREKGRAWTHAESRKVRRLLFRLVNRVQPALIVDAGTPSAASLYLKAACLKADYTFAPDLTELFLERGVTVDFLYLHDYRHPEFMQEAFWQCAARSSSQSLFVVQGIRYTREMRKLWTQMQQDERVGISFDLYDLGLLFFDKSKQKQHYVVNY